ncbi:MAG: DUF4102 domain-containing protein [Chryseobacterium sp.]|nr:DUF4102 domain-containing protein [Chryseobacterium sp.]
MNLTDKACKSAQPKQKSYKLSDGKGLYLEVMPNGSKYWRFKYRFLQKEKRLALGVYDETGLADARKGREQARELLRQNIDPSEERKETRRVAILEAETSFKSVAIEWHGKQIDRWSVKHGKEVLRRLELNIFPDLGKRPISKIDTAELLEVLTKIEKRGALYLIKSVRQICSQVFRYGIQRRKCTYNPTADLHGAFRTKKTKHFSALEPKDIPELLLALNGNAPRLYHRTIRATRISMLTFARPSEICGARWSEIDFEKKEWRIPASRMKGRQDHIVPLSKQALAILKEQKEETYHFNTEYVFPSLHKPAKALSNNTVRLGLHKLGFKDRMTAHGFRALARTAIREELNYEPDIIEVQLAHKPAGALGAAYDRSKFIKKRHIMMQKWADYLDKVEKAAQEKIIKEKFEK